MARKKRTEKPEQQSIVFDSKARYKYLTGFRKRKLARRKKGLAEDLEAERKDNIDVRKEHREEVKERWKKLKSAEKHVEKLIALQDAKRQRLAIKDNAPEEGDDDDYSPVGEPLQMITFEQEDEDDDPFGGCEVTTTIPEGQNLAGKEETLNILALANGPSEEPAEGSDNEETALMVVPPEDPEVRARRRAFNIAKAEAVRKKALAKKVVKLIDLKKKQKKGKGKKKKKGGKNKKVGAKTRRKRK